MLSQTEPPEPVTNLMTIGRVPTSTFLPAGSKPRTTLRELFSANWPGPGSAPLARCWRGTPSTKTSSGLEHAEVPGLQGVVPWVSVGTDLELTKLFPLGVKLRHTSEPLTSAPSCPTSVRGFLIVMRGSR